MNVGATRGELRGIGGFPPTEAHRRHCNALPKAASSIVHTRPRHAATRTPCAARRNSPSPVCRNAPPRYNRTSHDVPPLETPTTARSASTLAPAPPWGQIRRPGPLRRGGRTGDAGRRSPLVHGYVLDPTATGRGGAGRGEGARTGSDESRRPGLSLDDEGMSADPDPGGCQFNEIFIRRRKQH